MRTQRLLGTFMVTVLAVAPCTTLATADEPGVPIKLQDVRRMFSGSEFIGCALAREDGGNTAVCYGVVKLAGKPRYTYFLMLKVEPAKILGTRHALEAKGAKGDVVSFDGAFGTLPMAVSIGDKTLEFTYKFKADRKAGTIRESIKIGGKEYDKDVPRVFLVDLTQKKITCRPVKDARPEPAGSLDRLAQAVQTLRQKNADVKKFFEAKAKK